jgi:hypothetical protein
MSGISRAGFGSTFDNHAIDTHDPSLSRAASEAGIDLGAVDGGDGKADGVISGDKGLDRLYDAINALDSRTAGPSSDAERTVLHAARGAAIAPVPISRAQGHALAGAARRMLAEEKPDRSGVSPWALAGRAQCKNPALGSRGYAGADVWKCNVFVGEAFNRAGLSFPLSAANHYAGANALPGRQEHFQSVAQLADVREGDLLSISRRGDSGHVEIVTGVSRGPDGQVQSVTTLGAHEFGLAEGTATAAPLIPVAGSRPGPAGWPIGDETFHLLRPLAPPSRTPELPRRGGAPIKG